MEINGDIRITLSEREAHAIIIEALFRMESISEAQYQKGLEIIQKGLKGKRKAAQPPMPAQPEKEDGFYG